MLKHIKTLILFSVITSLMVSCTKDVEPVIPVEPDYIETPLPDEGGVDSPPEEESEKPSEETNSPEEQPNSSEEQPDQLEEQPNSQEEKPSPPTGKPSQPTNSVEVGNGSGDLTIDGNDAKVKGKSLIVIKSGTYGYIKIQNIDGNLNAPVLIKNAGQVTIKGAMETNNITNVTIAGDHVPGVPYGFNFHDVSYRAFILSGRMSGVTLKSLSFKNVRDYVIYADLSNLTHQGGADSRVERFKILNSKFDNATGIQFRGNFDSGQDNGFIKDLEIAHNIIVNSNGGNFASVQNVQDYNIHHNVANNLNPNQNDHNGIFHMIGNGKFHNNKFTNYQGNMIRAWVFSRGSSPATIEIYNNVAYNTRKYSAFEIQGFDRYIIPGKSTHVNAKVFNNTVGKMNTSKDWEGVVLDLYNYGGTLEYFNNLGFELYSSKQMGDMINNMSSVKIVKNDNNKYFSSSQEAVFNVSELKSKHSGIGSSL